jgi:catechol 2,3-dioxygenase-like lactoylglutathione lyase family enzyme
MDMNPTTHPHLRIGEVVLRTGRYEEMRAWYRLVLDLDPYYENLPNLPKLPIGRNEPGTDHPAWATQVRLAFFRLSLDHPYQQVIALFDVPGTGALHPTAAGLHHMQLREQSLQSLATDYRRLKAHGVEPFRTVDHGPSMSFYYKDPDANVVELAASNHATIGAYLESLDSLEFKRNPSGVPVDADFVTAAIEECAGALPRP